MGEGKVEFIVINYINMYLKQLKIKNFKWYKDEEVINFTIPDIEQWKIWLTIIVWPNNSGKTTILDSILKLKQNARILDTEFFNISETLKIEFYDKDNNITTLKNIDNWSQLRKEGNFDINKFSLVSSRRQWWHKFQIGNLQMSSYERNSLWSVENKYQIDSYFWQLLSNFNQNSEKKERLTNFLKKLIPWFNTWTIATSSDNQDYIKYKVNNEKFHEANLLWDWVISLFKIWVYIIDDTWKILYLDEPELSLHPDTQKLLSKEIIKYSKNKQIIINTHSPYFINLEEVKNWLKVIRTNKINWEFCKIFEIDSTILEEVINWLTRNNWQKPQAFDIVWKEIFFWNNIVFVEWQEDVWLINNYINKENIDINFSLFWYWSWWAENIKKMLELAKKLWLKAWAIYDADKEYEYNNVLEIFSEFKILKIEKDDIRDKYKKKVNRGNIEEEWNFYIFDKCKDSNSLLKEGIFDKDWNIKESYKENFNNLINNLIDFFNN